MKSLLTALAIVFATPAWAEVPRVATDIPAVQSLVAQVMGDLGTPQLVMQAGASPHSYAMRPSEAQMLAQSDILIWIGADQSPWLAQALTALAPDAASLELLETPNTRVLPFRQGVDFAAHDHADDDHTHDPHAWLDPLNAKVWLGEIATALAARDPDNLVTYIANANTAAAALDTLTADITAQLAPYSTARFIVFHDAYHYFETRFGLTALAAVSLGDAAAPGPARIADLRALVAAKSPTCAFGEPQFNPRLLATVTEGTAVKAATLDPIGAALPLGPDLYVTLLRDIASAVETCLRP